MLMKKKFEDTYQFLHKFLIDNSTEFCRLWRDPQPPIAHVIVDNKYLAFVETEKVSPMLSIIIQRRTEIECASTQLNAGWMFTLHTPHVL